MSSDSKSADFEGRVKLQPRKLSWWLRRVGNVGAFFFAGVLLIVVLGLAQRIGWLSSGMGSGNSTSAGSGQQIYTCPMHPQIRQEGEGRCPICGMALVPAATASSGGDDFAIQIEPAQRRVANIQTAPVVSHPVISTIRTIGSIRIDESRKATIASYVDGRIERLFADYTGVFVEPNDHLAVIYSPQLYAAQVEYLEAIESQSKLVGSALQSVRETQDKLVRNARQRLIELGLSEQQLLDLEKNKEAKSRLTIYAPIGGTVIEKLAEEGMYTKAGEPIYRVANLSTVWLMLELYPADAAKIRFGQVVKAELNSMPGKTLQGRVAFVDPEVDPSNRTVGVRVEFKNANGELRPGDYAEATIEIPIGPKGDVYDAELADKWISPMHPQIIQDQPGTCPICGMELVPTSRYGYSSDPVEQTESLTIPRTALLMAGEYSVVYVETEPGRFEIRSVKVGPILKDEVVIVDGLKVSESVATSGNFLIDSQMQLAGKPSLIDPTRAIKKQSIRNTPLQFDDINVSVVNGETGAKLEELFQAYFGIQQAFAADKRPTENQVKQYQDVANALLQADQLDDDVLNLIESTLDPVAHLHHHKIDEARQKFKPISHAVVRLATIARGESAKQPFHQFFCPMVKQGEGDWLQDNDLLSNPYWGSEMLRCGELVRTISPDQQTLVDDTPAQGDQ